MNVSILKEDIDLIAELDVRYHTLTMNGIVPESKKREFDNIKKKLRSISDFFKQRYDSEYGTFISEQATGNPVGRGGNLRRVWSGIFKGSRNKQYAAQISFVINTKEKCLDVGLYFGRASSHQLEKGTKEKLEAQLIYIGSLLYSEIRSNEDLKKIYYSLFDYGFKAERRDIPIDAEAWLSNLKEDPTYSSITFSLYPNKFGYIDTATIDLYVSMVLPLMSYIPEDINNVNVYPKRRVKPLTPEQRAKQAELRTLIGIRGEEYVMKHEVERLKHISLANASYPIHQALVSDSYSYDILSCDDESNDIYIEVKTTTLLRTEQRARFFFISAPEYRFYLNNKASYRLYRVYDIYGTTEMEIIDLSSIEPEIDGYRIAIPLM
jgi:hypothetical protein